jgi:hypothetical protein
MEIIGEPCIRNRIKIHGIVSLSVLNPAAAAFTALFGIITYFAKPAQNRGFRRNRTTANNPVHI